jgi:predicted HicB family RNase H-like nuclease
MGECKTFSLRLAIDLHAKLVAWAKAENRSLNNLIETILKHAVAEREQKA